ncbi:hypothetical protein [Azospirillum sp. sgz302134]
MNDVELANIALDMARRRVSTALICKYTGLPAGRVRAYIKEATGESPTAGPTRQSATIVDRKQELIEATIALLEYLLRAGPSATRTINREAWLQSYDAYLLTRAECRMPGKPLTINEVHKILADYRSPGQPVSLAQCSCGSYFVQVAARTLDRCPLCYHAPTTLNRGDADTIRANIQRPRRRSSRSSRPPKVA